jgi:hypothetical protein
MRDSRTRNRDVALTTLIDLLVQVVFVFTIVLIVSEVIEGSPEQRGYVTPAVWKTLISIFDIDPRNIRNTDEQALEMRRKYTLLREELDRTKAALAKSEAKLTDTEKKLAVIEKQTGRGPGNPPCLDKGGKEMVVFNARIDNDGNITVIPEEHGTELQRERPLTEIAFSNPLSPDRFRTLYLPWRRHGLEREPVCAYKATVSYDPRAQAGKYEPARRTIANYFTLSGAPQQFGP